ncbi:hypothetical protein I1E95_13635 [Synechococcus sp. CBW1107]|uniref:hypothetical protein n=1 Tax=unclassified Synechococcus TaxID=2626047 RepID=UPI0018CE087E|nr:MULTISPECIES: hypothetical protein [unclassified Synechococcus]QPN56140.1 hypothetical protein I1E95_13635 [Synechococcus sp. CBW1107]
MHWAPWRALCAAAALPCLIWVAPAHCGSVSADSVWSRDDALQRARQLVPRGAIPGRHRCQELTVGMGNYRYRCSVEFSQPPAGQQADQQTAPQPQPMSPLQGPAEAQPSP